MAFHVNYFDTIDVIYVVNTALISVPVIDKTTLFLFSQSILHQ